jgi:hypothetical protein
MRKLIMKITKEYLLHNPDHIFVFGDNLLYRGYGGAAALRDLPNTYGFITKKAPNNNDESFYTPEEYESIFINQLNSLIVNIEFNTNKMYLISKLGAGLANKYNIYEKVIEPRLKVLTIFPNVIMLD